MIREPCCNPRRRFFPGSASAKRGRFARRGISVLWLIVTLPIFVSLFVGVVVVGNIWLARVELENALEAAALAAVKEWGEKGGGDTLVPRNVGVAYAGANTISGAALDICTNYGGEAGSLNQNLLWAPVKPNPATGARADGNLVFGAVTVVNSGTPGEHVKFDARTHPSCESGNGVAFGVRAQAIAPVANPLCKIGPLTLPTRYVTVKTTAIYDCVEGRPRLIRVDEFIGP